jgi:hypothetical protein
MHAHKSQPETRNPIPQTVLCVCVLCVVWCVCVCVCVLRVLLKGCNKEIESGENREQAEQLRAKIAKHMAEVGSGWKSGLRRV